MKRLILVVLLFIMVLTGCGTQTLSSPFPTTVIPSQTQVLTQGTEGHPWWNDTVFYEIFVRSFRDSDGDGIGDFNGITEKLDYLHDLGIRGLWLMPINPSPSNHGYHITDYYGVEPDYGTMDDFKHLLEEAHKHDIKIIIDFVLNHTSTQHPWFQSALTPESPYRDWYVWSETDPGTRGPWNQQVWYQASNGRYFYTVFSDTKIADLNYENPAVREEMKKVTTFWLKDVGVDGFRLDAVRYIMEDGERLADSPANHTYLEEWGQYFRAINPQAFSVGEVWTEIYTVSSYTKDNTEVDSVFNFDFASSILKSINEGSDSALGFTFKTTVKLFPDQDNSNFLTNHDMNRAINQLGGDVDKAKTAASILLTAPGIPFIYYGEEIGMSGIKTSGDFADVPVRSPMQWMDTQGAGFTEGTPWEAVNSNYTSVNVQKQTGDNASLLEHYRTLIQLRNTRSALRVGKTYVAESNSNKLISYLRVSADETLLVIINIDDEAISDYNIELSSGPLSGQYTAESLLESATINSLSANDKGGFDTYTPLSEFPPYSMMILQLTK